ncbi:cellulase family glycosylhydrolase [Candidatus Sumerlaeota bacterium]|nr:cellulase family glycosylhydrolase [Candidatus Sumerlaeota bacterium]
MSRRSADGGETNQGAGGTFRVHPSNPRCFLYQGKPMKILTSGEHYGAALNGDFDYDVYLDEMQKTGQNMTRTFTFYREKPSSIPGPGDQNTLAPRPEAAVMPWLRAQGSGKGGDGLEKFDLDQWNLAYFARWKDFVRKCAKHGVVCEVVLFCNPYNREKYDLFPSAAVSNINGVGRAIGDPREFMMLKDPTVTAFQERFVRKMATELNEFDNVYFEICNEPNVHGNFSEATEKEVVAWQLRMAGALRKAEASLPKRHLIAVNAHYRVELGKEQGKSVIRHDDLHYFNDPDIDIINYHYISAKADAREFRVRHLANEAGQAGNIWRFLRERDRWTKPIVFDETFSGIVRKAPERYAINRAEAWEMLLSGGAGYDNLDWSFTPADETGSGRAPIADGRKLDGRPLREWYSIFRKLLAGYDLAALVPAVGLLQKQIPGYGCAASTDGNHRHIVYFVDEQVYRLQRCATRPLDVKMNLPTGRYSVRTFNPRMGQTTNLPHIESRGEVSLAIPAFDEDVAVLIEAVD